MKKNNKALLIIDYQNDFVDSKNGSLYVKNAEKLLPNILNKINECKKNNYLIIASKDWHPRTHNSFKIWPSHCIQNEKGSFLYKLDEKIFDKIILKGQNIDRESYSAFFDETGTSNGLDEYLKQNNVNELIICGVALDICVSHSFVDAIKLGYKGYLDLNLCAYINNKINF